jgi:hypothetical protein
MIVPGRFADENFNNKSFTEGRKLRGPATALKVICACSIALVIAK